MRRTIGAGLLGLILLVAPQAVRADEDPGGEAFAAAEEMVDEASDEGSNRNLILAAILAVVVIGGGIALSRRGGDG